MFTALIILALPLFLYGYVYRLKVRRLKFTCKNLNTGEIINGTLRYSGHMPSNKAVFHIHQEMAKHNVQASHIRMT
jgi:hypothetical protein